MIGRLVVLAVVLLVVLVGADRGAAHLAGRAVAAQLQRSQQLAQPPDVSIAGFPFLTQALAGRYDAVSVTIRDLPATNGLVVDRLDATLNGVHAPAGQALSGRLATLPVDTGDAVAHVSFASLQAAARQTLGTDLVNVTFGRATANRVSVGGTMETLLGSFTLKGQAQLAVSRGRLSVKVLPETISGVPAELRDQLAGLVNLSGVNLALPFGFTARSVTVDATGLQLRAHGTSMTIGR